MGSCFSKKKTSSSSSAPVAKRPSPPPSATTEPVAPNKSTVKITESPGGEEQRVKKNPAQENEKEAGREQGEGKRLAKEVLAGVKHRKSHDRVEKAVSSPTVSGEEKLTNNNTLVRTSSRTKEEVDAILIQCGRLSRSDSSSGSGTKSTRKYSGSKRSFDFDQQEDNDSCGRDRGENNISGDRRDRERQRESGARISSPQGRRRRRTPSRERDEGKLQQSGGWSGRRVSRSPGRRSETTAGGGNNDSSTSNTKPGKMVSIPATVTSTSVIEKSNNSVNVVEASDKIKRVSGLRAAASPRRSRSPIRANKNANANGMGCNSENQPQPPLSRSRSSSRKADKSPYRRNPLSEIDTNTVPNLQPNGSKMACTTPKRRVQNANQKPNSEEPKPQQPTANANITVTTVASSFAEGPKPQTITRSRSLRRSRDLDINPEALLNPTGSPYTALLLEDIQNFHQKSSPPLFPLPPCVTNKACSITSSNLSGGFSEDQNKKILDVKGPLVESEVLVKDDLTEPSFHKYVTVTRGGSLDHEEMEEQESSGSNSFMTSATNHWGISSSSWEPSSADSTDQWSSRSNTKEFALPESGSKRNVASRGKVGAGKGLRATPVGST